MNQFYWFSIEDFNFYDLGQPLFEILTMKFRTSLFYYLGPIHLEDEMSFQDEIIRPGDEVLA